MSGLSLATFALLSLRRRGRHSALSVMALAIFVAAFGSVLMLEAALDARTNAVLSAAPDMTLQRLVAGRALTVSTAECDRISAIPGVRRAYPRLWGYVDVPSLSASATVIGLQSTSHLRAVLSEGRQPRDGLEVVVGHTLARAFGVRVGESIALNVRREPVVLRVVGITRASSDLVAADALLVTEPTARALLGLSPDEATDLAVQLTRSEESAIVAEKILTILPDFRVLSRPSAKRAALLTLTGRASFATLGLLPALVVLILLLLERLSAFDARERREIGLLKALGFSTSALTASKLIEATIVALTGTVAGLVIAYVHVHRLGAPLLRETLLGWSRVAASTTLEPSFGLADLFGVVAIVVVPYVALSALSAWRIAFVDADVALRGES